MEDDSVPSLIQNPIRDQLFQYQPGVLSQASLNSNQVIATHTLHLFITGEATTVSINKTLTRILDRQLVSALVLNSGIGTKSGSNSISIHSKKESLQMLTSTTGVDLAPSLQLGGYSLPL